MMGDDGVGIESDGALEFAFGSGDVPGPIEIGESQRVVSVGERVVEGNGALGCGDCTRVRLTGGHERVFAEKVVAIREAGIGRRVVGIVNDGLREVVESLMEIVWRALVPVIQTLQIKFAGFWVGGFGHAGKGGSNRSAGRNIFAISDWGS